MRQEMYACAGVHVCRSRGCATRARRRAHRGRQGPRSAPGGHRVQHRSVAVPEQAAEAGLQVGRAAGRALAQAPQQRHARQAPRARLVRDRVHLRQQHLARDAAVARAALACAAWPGCFARLNIRAPTQPPGAAVPLRCAAQPVARLWVVRRRCMLENLQGECVNCRTGRMQMLSIQRSARPLKCTH